MSVHCKVCFDLGANLEKKTGHCVPKTKTRFNSCGFEWKLEDMACLLAAGPRPWQELRNDHDTLAGQCRPSRAALPLESQAEEASDSLRMTMLRRRGSCGAGLSEGGLGTNTRFARFRNTIFANRVLARFRECEMHVFLKAYAIVLSLKYLGFAGFRNYDFAGFRNLLHTFA